MSLLHRRQGIGANQPSATTDDTFSNDWWYSSTAYAIKWAVVGAIFILFLVFFVGGYWHARRRMSKGLAPLSYHKFIVPRRRLAAFYAAHPHLPESQRYNYNQQFSFYRPGYDDSRAAANAPAYHMGPYGHNGQQQPPPPAYGHDDYVPAYTPPQGLNKTDPDQNYQAPMGPPPSAAGQGQGQGQGQASGTRHQGGDLGSR